MRKHPLCNLLGKLKLTNQEVTIEIMSRGSPGDVKKISLRKIQKLRNRFFLCDGNYIPYHRVKNILKNGKVIWSAKASP